MVGRIPIPGNRCWAEFCGSYGLPPGLADRTPLVIVDWNEFVGTVRDEEGHVWSVNRVQIDTGYTFHLDGEECHESHPKSAVYLQHSVRKLNALLETSLEEWTRPVSRFACEEQLSRTRWYLERNGYDPDGPIPAGPAPRLTAGSRTASAPNPRLPVGKGDEEPRRMRS